MRIVLMVAAMLMGLSACAGIERVPGTEYVRLLPLAQAAQCQKIGRARTQVMEKVAFVERDQQKVADELLQLAKNEAVRAGGNALTLDGDIHFGSRQFIVYRCPD